jgi:hypothetical protein
MRVSQIQQAFNDTTNYKPVIVNSSGDLYKLDRWPSGGGGSGTVTSISQGYGIINSTNPITTTGTQRIDTFAISTRAWRDKLADSLGAIIATKGTGTVTNFSAGDLSPLFTTSEATTTTTPALSFSLSNAGAYTVFGNQTNASAAPSFAKLNINTIDATGTPSATTYLRGDGSWAAAGGSSAVNYIAGDSSYVGVDAGVGGNGTDAGPANAFNFFLGQKAGMNNVYGKSIVAMGRRALETFVGQNVAATDTTGIIAIGNYALYKYVSNAAKSDVNSGAVAIGPFSQYNTTSPTTDNTSIGLRSLFTNTTGAGNTAIGVRTLQANLTGSSNTAIGNAAMRDNTASNNVAIGASAMAAKTRGSRNVAIGGEAMSAATAPGDGNVAVGDQALSSASLTGAANTVMGRSAGSAITSGASNIVLTAGWLSGSVTSGSGNIVLASNFSGGTAPTSGSRNLYVGDRPSLPSATANDQMAIGMNAVTWMSSDVSGSHRRWTINGTTSNFTSNTASVTFDITGTAGGFRPPQMTRAQKVAISTPAQGIQVYDTDSRSIGLNLNGSTTTWGHIYADQDTVATDASFTLPVYSSFVILPTITNNRTLTIPAAASYENKTIIIKVANSAGFAWSVSPGILDNTDATVTALTNDKVYTIYSDGTNWHIISLY